MRETTTDGCIEESRNGPLEISHVKRSQKLAANMDLITRRKKIRLLKGSNADDETVSRFTRSTRMPLRQYFHSRSNLAMNKDDWDIDSDEESDDEWLRQHRREVSLTILIYEVENRTLAFQTNRYILQLSVDQ